MSDTPHLSGAPDGIPSGRPVENPGAQLRVSDRERDEVGTRLREHCADGRLTLEEFGGRLEAALGARTRGELEALLEDLPRTPPPLAPPERVTHRGWAVAVFGDDRRRGRWNPGARTGAVSVFGDAELDLRSAEVTGPVLDVEVVAIFGDVDVIIPEGAPVEFGGVALFGDRRSEVSGRPIDGMPLVRVRATSIFGDVIVRSEPRPPGFLARLFDR